MRRRCEWWPRIASPGEFGATASEPHHAEVMLAVDDRHLRFRTDIAVKVAAEQGWRISMMTRVQTLNHLGRLYMSVVDPLHRHWIAPMVLRHAVDHAADQLKAMWSSAVDKPPYAMR